MSYEVPPGFEPHDRKSPLTAPWEPIYCKAEGTSVALGVEIREPHTNSRGLVHGGLVAALLDNVMGLACSKALLTEGPEARSVVTVSLGVEYLGMAKLGQWLTFEPHFVKAGKTVCFAEASAVADGVRAANRPSGPASAGESRPLPGIGNVEACPTTKGRTRTNNNFRCVSGTWRFEVRTDLLFLSCAEVG